jgi:putative ABC transport system permease protein
MLGVTLRGVRGHLVRFLLTLLAVVLGVAFVAGTFVLTDSLRTTFDRIADNAAVGTDVVVRGPTVNGSVPESGDLRTPIPLSYADGLARVDGVRRAFPDLQGSAVLVGKDGTAVRNGFAPGFGFDYRPDDPALPLTSGRGPDRAGEIAVEEDTLRLSGLHVGDRTRLVVGGRPVPVTIVGTVRFGAASAGATFVVLDRASAIREFAADGTVQTITLQAEPGVTQRELRDRVAAVLRPGLTAVTGSVYAAEQRSSFAEGLGFINTFLLVFAAVSLFVGAFLIANTFSMLVAQRTRELALLRAVGASRRQVTRVVLGEAAVLGAVGGLLGLLAGVGLARGLQAALSLVGLKISGGLPVQPRTVVVTLVVGVLVTCGSAVLPALRAGRIPPVAALRDDVALPERGLRLRAVLGTLGLAVGAAAMAAGIGAGRRIAGLRLDDGSAAIAVGAGAAVAFVGLILAAPLISRPVITVVAAPFVALGRVVGRLARDNTLRNPRRTATTATSLLIGLALVSAFSVLASSTKASVDALVDSEVRADFILNGGSSAFPVRVAQDAARLPGVAAVVDTAAVPVRLEGEQALGSAVSGAGLIQTVALRLRSGEIGLLDRGQMAVSADFADKHRLAVGDVVPVTVGVLPRRPLRIGAVYRESQAIGTDVLVPRALYAGAVPATYQTSFAAYVKAAPGVDPAQVRRELTELVKPLLIVSVQDREEFKAEQSRQVDQILAILYALLALSVVIATLGIVNTLALSVIERTREIGLLRAVGLSRGQLRRVITLEAVTTALFGAVLGTALGLALGVCLQRVLVGQGLNTLAVPWGRVGLTFVLAGAVGVVASVLPAWRATRLDVLRAIATE